jgi:hypothetical protein
MTPPLFYKFLPHFAAIFVLGCATLTTKTTPPQASQPELVLPEAQSLSKNFFFQHAQGISADTFQERWERSLKNPHRFFRSHVRAYYAITQNIVPAHAPIGLCLGDAHVQNFGFLEGENGEPRFLYNDLDDSGMCPVWLDALRYFTSLHLSGANSSDVSALIKFYGEQLTSRESPSIVPAQLVPDFSKIRKKLLKKSVSGDFFKRESGSLETVSQEKINAISALIKSSFQRESYPSVNIVDIVESKGQGGGSFGLTRYWVLVSENGSKDILEVKQTVKPASEFKAWGQIPSPRLQSLKTNLWGNPRAARIYTEGTALGETWTIRSRTKDSADPEDFDDAARLPIYRAQVSLMAGVHRKTENTSLEKSFTTLETWLEHTSQNVAQLYKNIFQTQKEMERQQLNP